MPSNGQMSSVQGTPNISQIGNTNRPGSSSAGGALSSAGQMMMNKHMSNVSKKDVKELTKQSHRLSSNPSEINLLYII